MLNSFFPYLHFLLKAVTSIVKMYVMEISSIIRVMSLDRQCSEFNNMAHLDV